MDLSSSLLYLISIVVESAHGARGCQDVGFLCRLSVAPFRSIGGSRGHFAASSLRRRALLAPLGRSPGVDRSVNSHELLRTSLFGFAERTAPRFASISARCAAFSAASLHPANRSLRSFEGCALSRRPAAPRRPQRRRARAALSPHPRLFDVFPRGLCDCRPLLASDSLSLLETPLRAALPQLSASLLQDVNLADLEGRITVLSLLRVLLESCVREELLRGILQREDVLLVAMERRDEA